MYDSSYIFAFFTTFFLYRSLQPLLYYKSNKSVIVCVKKSLNNGKSILFNVKKCYY